MKKFISTLLISMLLIICFSSHSFAIDLVKKLLGYAPRDLMRKKEDAYTEHNLDNPSLSGADLIEFMIEYPVLIERPIVLANEKAAIGRPPEQVLEIL
jgi:arsenate reductase